MTENEARARVIRSMCPDKVCRTCGEPSRRIVGEVEYFNRDGTDASDRLANVPDKRFVNVHEKTGRDTGHMTAVRPTIGFSDCGHDDWRPGVVLDPFA